MDAVRATAGTEGNRELSSSAKIAAELRDTLESCVFEKTNSVRPIDNDEGRHIRAQLNQGWVTFGVNQRHMDNGGNSREEEGGPLWEESLPEPCPVLKKSEKRLTRSRDSSYRRSKGSRVCKTGEVGGRPQMTEVSLPR